MKATDADQSMDDATSTEPAGTGSCPPWCTTDHDTEPVLAEYKGPPIHRTSRAVFKLPGDQGSIRVTGIRYSERINEVTVHGTWYGPDDVLDADLYVAPEMAAVLASLAEILAHATPQQHLEMAEAIRQAAAQITEPGDA